MCEFAKLLKKAQSAVLDGATEDALNAANCALVIEPSSIAALIVVAMVQQARNEWLESIQTAHEILALDANCAKGYALLGMAHSVAEDYEQAYRARLRAAELGPNAARYVLAGLVAPTDSDAENCYRTALTLDADWDDALLNLAILLRTKDRLEAEGLLRRALQVDADNAGALRELGLLLTMSDPESAELLLRKALALVNDSWTHIYLAVALFTLEKFEAADEEYLRGHELDPSNGALDLAANAYERLGDDRKAEYFRQRMVKEQL